MATLISHSPEQTMALGEQWGQSARPGWIIGLSGELGSGKTQLVKGIARGLGIITRVLSPTFSLVHEYTAGRLPLAHLDLYRLETAEQIARAGLEEYLLNPAGVTVVEWIDRWPAWSAMSKAEESSTTPGRRRFVRLLCTGEQQRQIIYEDLGD
ncbi:MAG TPA: tRNA (adenosine(37)-N6)-threonylcarbamoyltransferase complex ATPase subunit type 1 TsaE [Candidatus Dormibacteraeota bacterium]|nr:tRNA (adenosine(37)-N6)-threonylcarbamoyltransferase complex ATPase subunit type 1 TsaE [Candidatus Dormibacteraeota bacterium]